MTKPRQEINDKEYFKDIHFLYEILGELKSIDEVKVFFKDILTKSELRMLKRRWHIATFLSAGLDIRTVAKQTNTSTTTVTKMKSILEEGYGGLKLVLQRVHEKQRKEFKKRKTTSGGSKYVKRWLKDPEF